MTTHSPHIASVTPLKDFVVLRLNEDGDSTEAVSTADIDLSKEDIVDLERYIDVSRGEILFARGVILVEGDAEKFLVPVLAKNQDYDLDELGISVCSISGTNFQPYLDFIGPWGLNLPFTAFTDYDPGKPKEGGKDRKPLGPKRVVNQMMWALVDEDEETWEAREFDDCLEMAPKHGVFLNTHTFEVDLFMCGLEDEFAEAMNTVSTSKPRKGRMKGWASDTDSLDAYKLLDDIERVGKGRFAQRLASIITESASTACPEYIVKGVEYVAKKCRRT